MSTSKLRERNIMGDTGKDRLLIEIFQLILKYNPVAISRIVCNIKDFVFSPIYRLINIIYFLLFEIFSRWKF